MGLSLYNKKRDFTKTREPKGTLGKKNKHRFVVQEHHATALHFDFRLEMDGVLKSWAVPKGPSMNPKQRRLAMKVEDHPVEYIHFSGSIPEHNYGAGEVRVWDAGTYELLGEKDGVTQIEEGKVTFVLHGKKLKGEFHLVRFMDDREWLLMKHRDEYADETWEMERILNYGNRNDKPADVKSARIWTSKGERSAPAKAKASTRKKPATKKGASTKKETALAKLTAKSATKKRSTAGAAKKSAAAKKAAPAATKKTVAKKSVAKKAAVKKPATRKVAAKRTPATRTKAASATRAKRTAKA